MKNENTENQPAVTLEMAMAQVSQLYGENEEFRADFDADPRETLGKLIGSPMPEDTTVVVHHRQPKELHIVLPDADTMAAETGGEMSDESLGQVSAGLHFTSYSDLRQRVNIFQEAILRGFYP